MPAPTLVIGAPVLDRPVQLGHRQGDGRSTAGSSAGRPSRRTSGSAATSRSRRTGSTSPAAWRTTGRPVPGRVGVHLMTDDIQGGSGRRGEPRRGGRRCRRWRSHENGSFADDQGPGRLRDRRLAAGRGQGLRVSPRARHAVVVRAAHREYDDACRSTATCSAGTRTSMSDTPEFRYTTLGEDEDALAGIMDARVLPTSRPAGTSTSRSRTSTRRSRRSRSSAARSSSPREDTPYGRLARVEDPTGTAFRLVTSP